MKSKFTKIVSVLMMLVLSMSFVACGSKSATSKSEESNLEKLTAEELLDKISEAAKDIEGVSITGDIGAKISISGQEMEANVNLEAKANKEPSASYCKVDAAIDLLGQKQDVSAEVYSVMNGNTMELYTNVLDKWSYESTDLSEAEDDIDTEQIMDMLENIDYAAVSEYFDNIDVKTNGSNYELVFEVTSANLIDKLKDSAFASALEDADTSAVPDITVKFTLAVDGKTFLPKTVSLDIDMDSFESEGMEIELSYFEFELNFDSFDSVEITVPDEALEAKENGNDMSDLSDLFE